MRDGSKCQRKLPLFHLFLRRSPKHRIPQELAFSKIHLTFSLDTPIIKSTGDACWNQTPPVVETNGRHKQKRT